MAHELSRMWTQVDSQSISSKQLVCRLYRDTEEELQQLKQLGRFRDSKSSSQGNQEVVALRNRYDELSLSYSLCVWKLMALVQQLRVRRE
ncbi:hypothetical protein GQ600_10195 [Phytophthora cactorum]|nr:hypothetical protein GQ600_10195 [Phytophthora cactorum]